MVLAPPSLHWAVPATSHTLLTQEFICCLKASPTLKGVTLGSSDFTCVYVSPSSEYLEGPESGTGLAQTGDFVIGKHMGIQHEGWNLPPSQTSQDLRGLVLAEDS